MTEPSMSQVTITLGRSGQVVKMARPALDPSFPDSRPTVGSKRSIRDRLGSNIDAIQLNNKRQREESSRLNANGVDDMDLGKDDLRFKIMRKTVLGRAQANGQQNGVDLRNMLSRPIRPFAPTISSRHYIPVQKVSRQRMPEPKDPRQRMPEPKDPRQRMPEPKDSRQRMSEPKYIIQYVPESTRESTLAQIPPVRAEEGQPQMDSRRTSYSPWTLDRLRKRSPDGFLSSSGVPSSSRYDEGLSRRPMARAYDDDRTIYHTNGRTIPYMSKDFFDHSKPRGPASFMSKLALPAVPPKPATSFPAPAPTHPLPPSGIVQKSPYTVEELSVDSFLRSLGLEKYAIHFKAEEIDMATLRQMGDSDLKELGIPMGPRKKIQLTLLSRSRRQA